MSAPPPVSVRCVRCAQLFLAPAPPTLEAIWYRCPHCGTPAAVVAPRDPAPLFSWEVYPHLYPRLPPPWSPVRRLPIFGVVALLVVTVLLGGLAGSLAYGGVSAIAPTSYRVAGEVVLNQSGPVSGALVRLTGENGYNRSVLTGVAGTFEFLGVPAGGITLNASRTGLGYVAVDFFLTPLYRGVDGNPGDLVVSLSTTPSSNGVTIIESPFPDLETLVASLWSGAILLAVGAATAFAGAIAARRGGSRTVAIAGGAAGLVAPLVIVVLALSPVYPWAALLDVVLVFVGALVVVIYAAMMMRTSPAPRD